MRQAWMPGVSGYRSADRTVTHGLTVARVDEHDNP
jgi:hypothetical protein